MIFMNIAIMVIVFIVALCLLGLFMPDRPKNESEKESVQPPSPTALKIAELIRKGDFRRASGSLEVRYVFPCIEGEGILAYLGFPYVGMCLYLGSIKYPLTKSDEHEISEAIKDMESAQKQQAIAALLAYSSNKE